MSHCEQARKLANSCSRNNIRAAIIHEYKQIAPEQYTSASTETMPVCPAPLALEQLAMLPVCVLAGIGHRQQTRLRVAVLEVLVREFVAVNRFTACKT